MEIVNRATTAETARRRTSCIGGVTSGRAGRLGSSWPAASYSCIDRPMTSCPSRASSAAATDESTPPDMATTIRIGSQAARTSRAAREAPELLDDPRQLRDDEIDLGVGVAGAEAEADRVLRARAREAPSRGARATARACRTNRPSRSTPRPPRDRARSAATRPRPPRS